MSSCNDMPIALLAEEAAASEKHLIKFCNGLDLVLAIKSDMERSIRAYTVPPTFILGDTIKKRRL